MNEIKKDLHENKTMNDEALVRVLGEVTMLGAGAYAGNRLGKRICEKTGLAEKNKNHIH